jgi:hypothetical protein
MNCLKPVLILLVLFSTIAMLSCSSGHSMGGSPIGGSSKKCGCGVNKGMSGY